MLVIKIENPLATGVGLIGNLLSFLVILAPLPTFYRVYKKKSVEGFHSTPYVVALFSAMLWLYYAMLTTDVLLLTINTVGAVIESIYLVIYIAYAHKKARAFTLKLILLLDVGFYGCMVLITVLFLRGRRRAQVMGWICACFAAAVFIAPLSIIRQVMRTKSVEFMPFTLSLFLTLSAVAWFCYGLLLKDSYIALPNVIGVLFGVAQMVLYFIYMNGKKQTLVSEITDQDKNPATVPNPNGDIEMNKESIGVTTPEVESSMSVAGKNEASLPN